MEKTEIAQSVSAAYDSVNLINELNALSAKSVEQEGTLIRNKEHLSIMLGKDWFVDGCTIDQVAELTEKSK